MKKHLACAFTLVAALLCDGCLPYHFTEKPGISGTVLDANTKKAIRGANVKLTTYSFPNQVEKNETITTEADGSFLIPAVQSWGLYMVPLDPGGLKGRVFFQAEGYNQAIKEFDITTMGPATTKFEGVLLEHLP